MNAKPVSGVNAPSFLVRRGSSQPDAFVCVSLPPAPAVSPLPAWPTRTEAQDFVESWDPLAPASTPPGQALGVWPGGCRVPFRPLPTRAARPGALLTMVQ